MPGACPLVPHACGLDDERETSTAQGRGIQMPGACPLECHARDLDGEREGPRHKAVASRQKMPGACPLECHARDLDDERETSTAQSRGIQMPGACPLECHARDLDGESDRPRHKAVASPEEEHVMEGLATPRRPVYN